MHEEIKMVGNEKKTKTCDKRTEEEWISKLPDDLISEILVHLPTEDAVRTSLLSTRWRNLWQLVPGLDLDSYAFSNNIDAFVSFADKFFDMHSHRDSLLRKLRLRIWSQDTDTEEWKKLQKTFITPWIHAVTRRNKMEHLDLQIYRQIFSSDGYEIPLSIYTCKTLVHLRLSSIVLANAEFVSLPCLKIFHLHSIKNPREAAYMEKLISGSPVLEDLTITSSFASHADKKVTIQVCSQTLKRIRIDDTIRLVIDAPLLQYLRTIFYSSRNIKIINVGSHTRLDLEFASSEATDRKSLVHGILDDIRMVKDLVLRYLGWKHIFLYYEFGRLSRGFRFLSRLNAQCLKPHLEMLPSILESCPKLVSFILEVISDPYMYHMENRAPKVIIFSPVPECMVSSLKFVELKWSSPESEGEMGLVRYFLKKSAFLEKLRLDLDLMEKEKSNFLKEVVAMPRLSSSCEVLVL